MGQSVKGGFQGLMEAGVKVTWAYVCGTLVCPNDLHEAVFEECFNEYYTPVVSVAVVSAPDS
jgi:hypothetical protein